MVHIGKVINGLVKKSGMSVVAFAEKINYSRRNVYEIFKHQTIDTGLLIKIGKVLNQNLFFYYLTDDDIAGHHVKQKETKEEIRQMLTDLMAKLDKIERGKGKRVFLSEKQMSKQDEKPKKIPKKTVKAV